MAVPVILVLAALVLGDHRRWPVLADAAVANGTALRIVEAPPDADADHVAEIQRISPGGIETISLDEAQGPEQVAEARVRGARGADLIGPSPSRHWAGFAAGTAGHPRRTWPSRVPPASSPRDRNGRGRSDARRAGRGCGPPPHGYADPSGRGR
ncbi:MAG: hypothetical protein ACR2JF_13010 [Iamia sp.]